MNDEKGSANGKGKDGQETGVKKRAVALISALSGHTFLSKSTELLNQIPILEDLQSTAKFDDIETSRNKINQLLAELGQCREDMRSNENLIAQILVIAAAILGVIFQTSSTGKDIFDNNKLLAKLLFSVGLFIFIAVFSYINTLGITSVLRFHYMQYRGQIGEINSIFRSR